MEELVALLGHGSEAAERYLETRGGVISTRECIGGVEYVEARGQGLSWVLAADDRLTAIQLHAAGHEGYAAWTGPMPDGVTFDSGRSEVRRLLGQPDHFGEPSTVPILGSKPAWDRFATGQAILHFEYEVDPERGLQLLSVLPASKGPNGSRAPASPTPDS